MTQSHLFTDTIMHNFRHEINSILDGKNIMNMDELTKYFLPGELDTPENRIHVWGYFFANIHDLEICQAVEVKYLTIVLKKAFNNENFDFAFIFSDKVDTKDETNLEEILNSKMQTLVSFIIVERNECKKYGNAYALNYICSKIKGTGSLLVGLYVYSIFSHPPKEAHDLIVKKIAARESDPMVEYYGPDILHMGLLELSGGYQNVPALCLYSKFGFVEDEALSGLTSNCFRSDINIAMRTNYPDDMTPEEIRQKIVYILLGRETEFEKSKICKFRDPEMQGYIAWLYGNKKAAKIEYEKLKHQANFFINKLEDGSLKPEFKEKIDSLEGKLEKSIAKIMEIEALSSETTYAKYKQVTSTAMGKNKNKKTKGKKYKKSKNTKGKNNTNKNIKNKKSYKTHKHKLSKKHKHK
jgi:hypothetical protein